MSDEMKIPPIWQAMRNDLELHAEPIIIADGNDYAAVADQARKLGPGPPYMRRNPVIEKHWPWLPMTEKPKPFTGIWLTIMWKYDGKRLAIETSTTFDGHISLPRWCGDLDAIELLAWRPREVPTPFEGRWDE